MTFEIPEDVDPIPDEWWEPLLGVAGLMQESPRLLDRCFRVDDYMLMGRERRRGRPLVYLYKHRDTRRYLNLDAQRRAYAFVYSRSGSSDGSYRRLETLEEGVDGVGLWELPRLRPDLVAQRLGIPARELDAFFRRDVVPNFDDDWAA